MPSMRFRPRQQQAQQRTAAGQFHAAVEQLRNVVAALSLLIQGAVQFIVRLLNDSYLALETPFVFLLTKLSSLPFYKRTPQQLELTTVIANGSNLVPQTHNDPIHDMEDVEAVQQPTMVTTLQIPSAISKSNGVKSKNGSVTTSNGVRKSSPTKSPNKKPKQVRKNTPPAGPPPQLILQSAKKAPSDPVPRVQTAAVAKKVTFAEPILEEMHEPEDDDVTVSTVADPPTKVSSILLKGNVIVEPEANIEYSTAAASDSCNGTTNGLITTTGVSSSDVEVERKDSTINGVAVSRYHFTSSKGQPGSKSTTSRTRQPQQKRAPATLVVPTISVEDYSDKKPIKQKPETPAVRASTSPPARRWQTVNFRPTQIIIPPKPRQPKQELARQESFTHHRANNNTKDKELSIMEEEAHAVVAAVPPKQTRCVTTLFEIGGAALTECEADIRAELSYWVKQEPAVLCEVVWSCPKRFYEPKLRQKLGQLIRKSVYQSMISTKTQISRTLALEPVPLTETEERTQMGIGRLGGVHFGLYRQYTKALLKHVHQETEEAHEGLWDFSIQATLCGKLLKRYSASELCEKSVLACSLICLDCS